MFENFKKDLEEKTKAGEEGIPELVDSLLRNAGKVSATDLHLECRRNGAVVRLRLDGILYPVGTIPKNLMMNVVTRLKVMARVKTFDRRSPQDGRIEFSLDTGPLFLRASFLPTLHGEKAAVRFPDQSKLSFELEDLGFQENDLHRLLGFLEKRQGTLLLTGPISSGKTTTIYSILKYLIREKKEALSIATIEDPIEAEIEGISQTQIDPAGGLSYATGLRMLLRQDADVLVVGEIRDEETARMAIRAGLVGHLVISTIHSPDAAGVFTRLINMDLEPFLITSSLSAVVGQRLLRRLCPECKKTRPLSPEEEKILACSGENKPKTVYAPGGCPACHRTGYQGRTGIFEVLYMREDLRDLILQKPPTRSIRKKTREAGMVPLSHDAARKVLAGETSLEEFARVLLPV